MFVKWTLTYLTMDIIRGGWQGARGEGGGNWDDRGLGKARVRLDGKLALAVTGLSHIPILTRP